MLNVGNLKMKPRDFCYWLQGYFEIHGGFELDHEQIKVIKNHLNLVFKHSIDPENYHDEEERNQAQNIHDGFSDDRYMC